MEDNYFGKFLMIVIPFSKVLENEELCNELAKLNSYEEIYEFLLSIEDTGYTKEDVYNFCNFLIKKFEENKYEILASINDNTSDNDDTSKIQLNDDEISNVSGGSLKNQKSKFTATALAALSAITPFINSKISAVNANNPVIQSVAIEKDDRTKEAPKITGALAAQSKTVDKTKKEVSKTTGAPASQSKTVDKTKKEAPKTTGAPSTQSKTVDKTKKEAPKTAGAPSTQSKAINKIKEVAKTANSPVAQSKAIDKTKEVPKTASTPAAQSKAVDKTKKEAPKTADAPVAQSKAVNKTEKNVNVLVKEKKSTILSQLKQFWEDYGKTAAKLTIGTIIVCGSLYLSSVAIDKFQKYDVNKKFHKGLDDRPLVKKLYDEEKDKAGNEQLSDKQIMNNVGYVFENDSNSKSIAVSQINEVIKILNEAKSPLNILYDIFKGMFTPVTLFFGITQSISSGVEKFLKFANNFGSLDYTFQNVQRTVGKFTSWAEKQQEPLPLSLADIASNLKNLYAYGQGKAVEIARNHLLDWAIQKDLSEKTGEPCSNAMVMNFFGVSGVGKSFLAQQIAELLQRKCLTISSSIVDKESSVSVIDQLFGAHKYRNPYGSESEEDPTIVDFVKRFPGSVIVIDEYDKVWTKQLDEVLRNIIDYGVVTIRNQKIDFSGTIIILTSNEKGPEKILASGEKQNHVDTTGSITYNVAHDKSFSNRVRWVPFVNLSFKEYIPILKDHIYERVTEYWEKVFGIKINIKNSVIEKMSKFVEKQNQGARPIDQQVIPSINHAIFEVAKEIGIDNIEKSKGKSISVEFDSSSGEASASAS